MSVRVPLRGFMNFALISSKTTQALVPKPLDICDVGLTCDEQCAACPLLSHVVT